MFESFFLKKYTKTVEIANNVYYKHVKSQYKQLYISDYTKKIKSDKLYYVEMCTIHYYLYIFDFSKYGYM
jgi:hypothetical protein